MLKRLPINSSFYLQLKLFLAIITITYSGAQAMNGSFVMLLVVLYSLIMLMLKCKIKVVLKSFCNAGLIFWTTQSRQFNFTYIWWLLRMFTSMTFFNCNISYKQCRYFKKNLSYPSPFEGGKLQDDLLWNVFQLLCINFSTAVTLFEKNGLVQLERWVVELCGHAMTWA